MPRADVTSENLVCATGAGFGVSDKSVSAAKRASESKNKTREIGLMDRMSLSIKRPTLTQGQWPHASPEPCRWRISKDCQTAPVRACLRQYRAAPGKSARA